MKAENSFPQTPMCRRARFTLPLSCFLLIAGLVLNAQAQSGQTRPTARLIASANHAIAPVETMRPRTVATARTTNAYVAAPTSAMATTDERRVFELINQ